MQCKQLEAILADDDLNPLSPEAREHLAGCSDCRDLLADLSTIVVAARRFPAEVNPPERIWVAVRAQLEAEGVIRDADVSPEAPAASWWQGFAQFFRPRVLASVATAILVLAAGMYLMQHPGSQTQTRQPSKVAKAPALTPEEPAKPVEAGTSEAPAVAPGHRVSVVESRRAVVPPKPIESHMELAPSPTQNAYFGDSAAVLSQTESALPTHRLAGNAMVDASLRQNLRTLNEFINECETRLRQNPQDQMVREYLNMAYQQKAELLNAMMDSGRSEH